MMWWPKKNTRGMENEASLLSTKKVWWKDNAKTIMATKMNRIACNELIIVEAHFWLIISDYNV